MAETLSSYIGIDASYVKGANLRVNIMRFCKELLRSDKRSIGRLDARFTGIEGDASDARPEYDPSMTAILATYTSVFNDYLGSRLEVKTDMAYRVMQHFSERKWKWEDNSLPDTGESLRRAMGKNRNMKVLAAQGYYDLATPHMATEYMVSHMNMDPEVRKNLSLKYYPRDTCSISTPIPSGLSAGMWRFSSMNPSLESPFSFAYNPPLISLSS